MDVLRRFFPYLRPYLGHVAATMVATVLFAAFSGAAYWLSASFLSALFTGTLSTPEGAEGINAALKLWTSRLLVGPTPADTLMRAAVAILLAFLGKNLFGYLQLWYVSYVEQRVIKNLRDELFEHLVAQDLAFFQAQRRGHLISTVLNDVERLNQALNKSFTKLVRDPLNAVVLLVLLFAVSWKLTLVAAVVVPAVGWTVQFLSRRIKSHARVVQEVLARLTGHLQETLSGIRVVKAFVTEPFEARRFQGHTAQQFRSSYAQERLRRLVIPLNEVVGVVIISALLYMGGQLVLVRGTMGSEDFIRFLVLLFALLNPLLSLGSLVANIRLAEAFGERVFGLLDTSSMVRPPDDPVRKVRLGDGFRLEGVCFRYGPELPDVLAEINLSIRPGERIAIVGKSGSGKSTLVNLLPRFFDPTDGRILLDGTDLRRLDLDRLRALFGIVTQDVILFHDTVEANIGYAAPGASFEQIQEAARAAHAEEFIHSLPEGYGTVVGEQGALFSGGQRQRISIARALLRRPEVVILDEATSALDPEAEEAVSGALDQLTRGRTVLVVTHRLASARSADRIVLLKEGRIEHIGTHEELLAHSDLYRDLARRQRLVSAEEAARLAGDAAP